MTKLTDDTMIAQLLDRLQRMVNEINTILAAAYLPPKAVSALVETRVSIISTYRKLSKALIEAEQDSNDDAE